ncbi:MAG TPA: hypothetical protein GXX26_00475 [Clostridiaceae bacterium]|nr:hypothetical protein [Clostridiaceae bacterium]
MTKKVVFLLVMMFVLLLASVTAFAAGTDSATPEAGFTEDKAGSEKAVSEISVSDLEAKYGDIFFGDVKSTREIVSIVEDKKTGDAGKRIYPYNLRYFFEAMALEMDTENPVIMLTYIKVDGVYVPLTDVVTKTNITQEVYYLSTTVDLAYLGSNKVNEIRIIAFKKNDIDKLALDENVQIIDIKKSVRPWNLIEKIYFEFIEMLN